MLLELRSNANINNNNVLDGKMLNVVLNKTSSYLFMNKVVVENFVIAITCNTS